MFRLMVKEPGCETVLFISQPFNRYKMHEREVETEYGRLAVREGLKAVIIRADKAAEYSMSQRIHSAQEREPAQRECA